MLCHCDVVKSGLAPAPAAPNRSFEGPSFLSVASSGRERLVSNAGVHTQMLINRPVHMDQAVQRLANQTLQSGGDEWDGSRRRSSFVSHMRYILSSLL